MRSCALPALLLVLAACSPGAPPHVPTPLESAVDGYLEPFVENGDFRGVVLIARGDDVLLHKSYGPEGLDAQFRIASLTKTFTSAAVILLRDEGKLSLDDPLSRYVGGFPDGDRITIEHLLAHASGVANPDPFLGFSADAGLPELVEDIRGRPLQFEPGTDHRYSNGGYNVLARVIERASGMSYDDFLRRRILQPLGMNRSGNFSGGEDAAHLVPGYRPGPGPSRIVETPETNGSAWLGSGSMITTAEDLRRWGQAVGREDLFSMNGLAWPYGWGKVEIDGHHGIDQTGATVGFVSSLLVFPEEDLQVICLNNVEAGSWVRWSRDLATLAFGGTPEIAALPEETPLPPADIDRLAGTYVSEGGTTLHLRNESGLTLYWEDWPVGKYLTPLGGDRFYPRSDNGTILFEPEGAAPPERLVWDFGEERQVYTRR